MRLPRRAPPSDEIKASLALINPADTLLEAADDIESLQERLGAVEKAGRDRVNIEGLQQENEHQARRLLRELGRPADLDEAESLRLRADVPAVIRGLGQKFAELRGQADEAQRTIARHEEQIKNRELELEQTRAAGRRRSTSPRRAPGPQSGRPRITAGSGSR